MSVLVEVLAGTAFAGAVVALFVATVNDVRTQLAVQETVGPAASSPHEGDARA